MKFGKYKLDDWEQVGSSQFTRKVNHLNKASGITLYFMDYKNEWEFALIGELSRYDEVVRKSINSSITFNKSQLNEAKDYLDNIITRLDNLKAFL